jgi:hypothetical protein
MVLSWCQIFIHYIRSALKHKEIQVFYLTIVYLGIITFSNSNTQLLIISLLFIIVLRYVVHSTLDALLLAFIVCLPIAKGKSINLQLLPKYLVVLSEKQDLTVYFPIYIADFFLLLLLYFSYRFKQFFKMNNQAIIPIIVFGMFTTTSIINSVWNSNYESILFSDFLLIKGLFILYLYSAYRYNKEFKKILLFVLFATVIFQGIYGFMQYFHGGPFGNYIEATNPDYILGKTATENQDLLRISGTFIDPDLYGTFMIMNFILFFSLWIKDYINRKKYNTYLIFTMIISSGAIFLTGDRALYLVYIILTVVLFYLNKNDFKIILSLRKIWLIPFTIVLITILPYVLVRMQNLSLLASPTGSGVFRIQMIQYSFRLGMDRLFGVGLNTSPYYFASKFFGNQFLFGADYPHNLFMQIFAEIGLIGLLIFLFFLYISFRRLFIYGLKLNHSEYFIGAIAFIFSAMFYPMFLDNMEVFSLFLVFLGLSYNTKSV